MWRSLLLLGLLGCVDPTPADTVRDPSGEDTDAPIEVPSDEEVLRDLIAGLRTDVDAVLHDVAWRGGLPAQTREDTFLFVAQTRDGPLSLAGDFNGWTPTPMTRGEGLYWAEVAIPDPAGQGYKFTDGEAWSADPRARSYTYDAHGELSLVAPTPSASRIDRWPSLQAHGLRARDLRVLVPAGEGPWPVLYVQDGQNLFDRSAFWGGWRLDESVTALDTPVLVVGIDASAARLDEYGHAEDVIGGQTYGGQAEAYARLVHEDVRGHVEAVYGSTGLDGLLGSSMGGLVSLYVAHRYPDAFAFAGSLSGTLGWGRFGLENPTMQALYEGEGVQHTVLYVDSGGSDGGDGCSDPDGDGSFADDPNHTDNYCTNRQFADAMAELGYSWDVDLFHWHEAGATHDEAAWRARVHRPLEIFVGLSATRGSR